MSVYSEAYKAAVAAPELSVTSAVLMAAARFLGEACKQESDAFMRCGLTSLPPCCVRHASPSHMFPLSSPFDRVLRCRFDNEGQPDKCLAQGAEVTGCGLRL
jgi:hypothetical protein